MYGILHDFSYFTPMLTTHVFSSLSHFYCSFDHYWLLFINCIDLFKQLDFGVMDFNCFSLLLISLLLFVISLFLFGLGVICALFLVSKKYDIFFQTEPRRELPFIGASPQMPPSRCASGVAGTQLLRSPLAASRAAC